MMVNTAATQNLGLSTRGLVDVAIVAYCPNQNIILTPQFNV